MKKLLIILIAINYSFFLNTGYTKNNNTKKVSLDDYNYICDAIFELEYELSKRNTTVVDELQNQISYYQVLIQKSTENEELCKIQNIIVTTQNLMDDFCDFKRNNRGSFNLIYSPAVATVIAYFNSCGYNLAAELLTHARDNNDLDSIYVPINKDDILTSPIYENIIYSNILDGVGTFPQSNNIEDNDLYYAIHSFYYSKSESGRVIVIQDRYDYDSENYYGDIAGIAINTMRLAQDANVLVPYYLSIIHNHFATSCNAIQSVYITSNDRLYEDRITIGLGEYKDYYITFENSGQRIIQTFGYKDSYMYLYDSNNVLIIADDDSGYCYNSLIRYYFNANMQYKIRVKFLSPNESGDIKLIITSSLGDLKNSSNALDSFDDIYETSSANFTMSTYSTMGNVCLFKYLPTEMNYYIIETIGTIDTYIYLIDPRLTYLTINTLGWFDDDSGDDYNAYMEHKLSNDIPYLIIYSCYDITNPDSPFTLHICKK